MPQGPIEATVQAQIERALAGDADAVRQLHDAFYPLVQRLACLLLGDVQDAQDVAQETFIYAFNRLEQYDAGRGSFTTWLKVITTSRCRDWHRRRRRRPWISLQQVLERGKEPEDAAPDHSPEVWLEQAGVQQRVLAALDRVPRKSREALVLRYFGDLPYAELAQALGCSVNTAKSRVTYGLRVLERLLDGEAGG